MSKKTKKNYEKDYTEPKLREELKEKILQEDKGGKPGQWSARKSQRLVKEYESHGGRYKHPGEKTKAQKSLEQWSEEDWQALDNHAAIRDGKTVRYLPKEVWDQLSQEERKKTNQLKIDGSKQGKQYIENPEQVREVLRKAHKKA